MFSRQLLNADPSKSTKLVDPAALNYRMGDYGYGDEAVRVFQLKKNGPVHSIAEFKVSTHMRLHTHKEYYNGDNSDIIGSDVQETNIFIHAQKYGLSTPEEFALSLAQHFLNAYDRISEANIIVEAEGWERLGEHEQQGQYKLQPHNHAFTRHANGRRYCEVVRKRVGEPLLLAGIAGLRIVKTAKAPFAGYVKGKLFTEGDHYDRILCVDINAKWQYVSSKIDSIDFAKHWHQVRELILNSFAGDPVDGILTTSVQLIAYSTERAILDAMPEICSVSIDLPNYTHLPFDFSRFPDFEPKADVTISHPKEVPRRVGYARLDRLEK